MPFVFLIERRKVLTDPAGDRGSLEEAWIVLDALLEAADAIENVARPAHGLAELTVADDVDPDLRLLADDIGNQ